MIIQTSLLQELLEAQPHLHPQLYFKSSLTALSHAMEDQVLAGADQPVIIASFQRERFYRQEAHRYARISEKSNQVYVLAAPETEFKTCSDRYETIAFDAKDGLSHEWHLIVVGQQYAVCLLCREHPLSPGRSRMPPLPHIDQSRRFEGIWTFDRGIACQAARLFLNRIRRYQPALKPKIAAALALVEEAETVSANQVDPAPFADRLVMYLQAGQYKQNKAYRQIAAQEARERLINSITAAIRRSLDPNQILTVATQELGQALQSDRCLIYRCQATENSATLEYEFVLDPATVVLMQGKLWPLRTNPLFQQVVTSQEPLQVQNTQTHPQLQGAKSFQARLQQANVQALLIVPVLYQGQLLGIVELHHCQPTTTEIWSDADVSLVEAIALQVGVALIQAKAYADLEDLNRQLEALDRTRSNLIAITGHELRTPLSTIQVCLESLASEPDMPANLRQVMLSTAVSDAERMRKLIQDFLTLSQLESGRVVWNPEPLPLQEIVDLALSSLRVSANNSKLPKITTDVPAELPLVRGDGEWLVEVLSKLLDNACKFTTDQGQVRIEAHPNGGQMLEVTVTDTGRGIEPDRLETVFDRFYQEEGALRRTTGGTGLGLAICRQIITNLGGEIWAESAGKDKGSQFHFTIPIIQ
ncbi:MAG: GAF domain-containing protein [Aphanocapsa sp. GSE-SYN-MK-11-07L]|nr:GAF domain-containing protein [Aphanocapsa sp. GSE-SYN-MK-11-07L]